MHSPQQLYHILRSFGIKAQCLTAQQVDNYIYYDLQLEGNCKVKDLVKYADEISLMMKSPSRPRVKVLHEQGVVRLEFTLPRDQPLRLFDLFTNKSVPSGDLICLLGQTVDGQKLWMDLAQNPHMIVAGTTGSGKSCLLHNIIANAINYNSCLLKLVDSKRIEFYPYQERFPDRCQVVYDFSESLMLLDSLLHEMEERYIRLREGTPASQLPYILLVIDEFADLIMQDQEEEFYVKLCRLAQKCRAARISIVLATQRPSVNIIGGDIKANFPARIACRVATHVDSRVILDANGAEHLMGKGDALLKDNFRYLERFQVAYTTSAEVCQYLGQ